jgi:hypothetical protein
MTGHFESNVFLRHVVAVSLDTRKHERFVLRLQELAMLWELWNGWPARHTDEDGNASFDDKNPVGQ